MEKLKDFIEKKKEKSASRKPRYGTRKLSVGLVSCVLGYCIFLSPTVVSAQVEGAGESTPSNSIEASSDISGGNTDVAESSEPAADTQATESTEATNVENKETEAVVDTNETPVAEVAETEASAETETKEEAPETEASAAAEEKSETEKEAPAAEVSEKDETREAEAPATEEKSKPVAAETKEEAQAEANVEPFEDEKENKTEETTPTAEENKDEEENSDVTEEDKKLVENVNELEISAEEKKDAQLAEEATQGNDISNNIINPRVSIRTENTATSGTLEAGRGEQLTWGVSFTTPKGTKEGDTFTVKLSDNMSLKGLEPDTDYAVPVKFGDKIIANAKRIDRQTIQYTFTKDIEDLEYARVYIINSAQENKS